MLLQITLTALIKPLKNANEPKNIATKNLCHALKFHFIGIKILYSREKGALVEARGFPFSLSFFPKGNVVVRTVTLSKVVQSNYKLESK